MRRGEPSPNGEVPPAALIVSGRRAPHLPPAAPPLHLLPEKELVERLREWGGVGDEVLRHRELRGPVLPAIRADVQLGGRTPRSASFGALQVGRTVG